jgi:hypothetical protein
VRTVTIRQPWSSATASVERLVGTNAYSTTGVRIGDQNLGSETGTGTLGGIRHISYVVRRKGGYLVKMAPATAAMVTWTTRQPVGLRLRS